MSYERSITAPVPKPARGRRWLAAALLESASPEGPWEAIEAVPVPTPEDTVPDTISSRHARFDPGYYRLQWYDDGQNWKLSPPVKVEDGAETSSGRWN